MLIELRVENFALVEKASLEFGAGLNLLTGETGAGKSILLDALGMVLGDRVGADSIRHGADRARVEGAFSVNVADDRVKVALEAAGVEPEDGLLILSRELSQAGRNVARINGRPVTVATLKSVGDVLVDIHGQHAHQTLLSIERHSEILDAWCGADALAKKTAVRAAHAKVVEAERELSALRHDARERVRTLDLLRFQRDEIEAAQIKDGEEDEIVAERTRLSGAERLHAATVAAYDSLNGGALDALSGAIREIERALRFDDALSPLLESLQSAFYAADEAMRDTRNYRDNIEFNPERLEQIENRLDTLKTLKRKYGDTLAEVLRYNDEIAERLERLENAEVRLADLETTLEKTRAERARCAELLTKARKKAAKPFAEAIRRELADLAMAATRLEVSIEAREPGPDGADSVELMLSPNPGEPLKPLAKIASGGELSRIMLALKSVLSKTLAVPTLIFDEIDTGIGGRTGTVLGEKLYRLGMSSQVLCITHLPQIAARGDRHFAIEKRVEGARTVVNVAQLDGETRVHEIARMLGGAATDAVVTHAREMLQPATK